LLHKFGGQSEAVDRIAYSGIPNANCAVAARGSEPRAIRAERERFDPVCVAAEHALFGGHGDIPYADGSVVGSGGREAAVGTECYGGNRRRVAVVEQTIGRLPCGLLLLRLSLVRLRSGDDNRRLGLRGGILRRSLWLSGGILLRGPRDRIGLV